MINLRFHVVSLISVFSSSADFAPRDTHTQPPVMQDMWRAADMTPLFNFIAAVHAASSCSLGLTKNGFA